MTMNSTSLASTMPRTIPDRRFSLIGWLLKKDSVHRNMARFSKMDDRMLRDIGLTGVDRDQEVARHRRWSASARQR